MVGPWQNDPTKRVEPQKPGQYTIEKEKFLLKDKDERSGKSR